MRLVRHRDLEREQAIQSVVADGTPHTSEYDLQLSLRLHESVELIPRDQRTRSRSPDRSGMDDAEQVITQAETAWQCRRGLTADPGTGENDRPPVTTWDVCGWYALHADTVLTAAGPNPAS